MAGVPTKPDQRETKPSLKGCVRRHPWRVALLAVAALFVVGASAAVVAVNHYLNGEGTRDMIMTAVREATGRDISINGKVHLKLSKTPVLVAHDVVFGNAPWGRAEHLARIDRFEMDLALEPLRQGRVEITRLDLIGGDIVLETGKDGAANWDLVPVEDFGHDEPVPEDRASRVARALALAEADRSALAEGAGMFDGLMPRWNFAGLNIEKVTLKDARVAMVDLVHGGRVDLAVAGMAATDVGAGGPTALSDVDMVVRGHRVRGEMTAELLDGNGGTRLSKLKVTVDGTPVRGAAVLAVRRGKGWIDADLTVPAVVRTGPLLPRELATVPVGGERRLAFDDTPIDFAWLDEVNGRLTLAADGIDTGKTLFRQVRAKLSAGKGKVVIEAFGAEVADGEFSISGSLARAGKDAATVEAMMTVRRLDAGKLVDGMGVKGALKGGFTDARIALTATGGSARELVSSLDGRVMVAIGGGEITQAAVDLKGADHLMNAFRNVNAAGNIMSAGSGREISLALGGVKILSELVQASGVTDDGAATTKLECAVVNVRFDGGLMTSADGIAVETEDKMIVVDGTLDFKDESLDMTVLPQSNGLLGLAGGPLVDPIRVSGTLMKPDVGINGKSVAVTVASIGAAFATGGMSVVAESVAGFVMSDRNPCQTALDG